MIFTYRDDRAVAATALLEIIVFILGNNRITGIILFHLSQQFKRTGMVAGGVIPHLVLVAFGAFKRRYDWSNIEASGMEKSVGITFFSRMTILAADTDPGMGGIDPFLKNAGCFFAVTFNAVAGLACDLDWVFGTSPFLLLIFFSNYGLFYMFERGCGFFLGNRW